MKRAGVEGARRGSARRGDARSGTRAAGVELAISQQLTLALAGWKAAQAAISVQLTSSLEAWHLASKRAVKAAPVVAPVAVAPPVKVVAGEHAVMEAACLALRAGGTFAAFERATRADWMRVAQMLFRRWPLPASVEVSDIYQELITAVAIRRPSDPRTLYERWEPGRGAAIGRYVAWNAVVWAVRWIHEQRGVKKTRENGGSRGRDASQFARPLSSFERVDGTSSIPEQVTAPTQQAAVEGGETRRAILDRLRSDQDRAVLEIYLDTGGCVQEAARILAERPGMGFRLKRDPLDMVERVVRHSRWAAERVMQAEVV